MSDEISLRILRMLAERPSITQRDLAVALGVSLGKVNYCLRALFRKSWVKAKNFKNSSNKAAYLYLLTPEGIEAKAKLTLEFLRIKKMEYETIRQEIARLEIELGREKKVRQ